MPTIWYNGIVTRIDNQTVNTKRFWIEVPELERFDFRAGQFITMDLPIHEKRLQRWRSYSIASAPDGTNVLELCIVRLDGGAATRYLFEEIKVGDTITFKGPGGAFVLPEQLENDLVLVCTGTGVAPFRSMLHDIRNRQLAHRNIHLIFGTRTAEGILYGDEFSRLQQEMPGFRYSVALSRVAEPDASAFPFEVGSGYVHRFYLDQYQAIRPDIRFYLCG